MTADATPAEILAKSSLHITPAEIAQVFGRSHHWFRDHRVRRRLYAQGFPRSVSRGVWLRAAVKEFVERTGGVRRPLPSRHHLLEY